LGAGTELRLPMNEPIGVRHALTMTASSAISLVPLLMGKKERRSEAAEEELCDHTEEGEMI
jgi:hypothetical protein